MKLHKPLLGLAALLILAATTLLYTRPDFMHTVNEIIWTCFGAW